jgi:hypothetical protein
VDGRTVTSEHLLANGEPGDAHQPAVRRLMADGLFEHMTILRDEWPDHPALRTLPAWADYEAGRIGSAYEWESLLAHSEPVLAGLAAGAYTDGSTTGASAPAPAEVRRFLADYQRARAKPFSAGEMRQAAGASVWVASYNARCVLDLQSRGITAAGPGTSLAVVSARQSGFLALVT